jgi:N-acetylmuramoyl-L-alanine amidase
MRSLLTGLCLWLAGQGLASAAPVDFEGVRFWTAPDHIRVVFDTSGPVQHQLFTLHNPERLVIDVTGARAKPSLKTKDVNEGLIKGVRAAMHKPDVLRIVLDLKQGVRPKSFTLQAGCIAHRAGFETGRSSKEFHPQAKPAVWTSLGS